jgi:hypothetical protein
MDGNTRLCTATAAAALKESSGCEGQPGSYSDIDHADVIALYGHNMAETQTVRRLYLGAAGVSVDWELLGQGAQAVKDADLLEVCRRCRPQTLRQMSWADAMLKVLSPQVWAR